MAGAPAVDARLAVAPPVTLPPGRSRSLFTDSLRRLARDRAALVGAALLLLGVALAIAAPAISRYGPVEQRLVQRLKPPSADHWFGTDNLGRDVFSRVVHGGRVSLRVGLVSVTLGVAVGAVLGLLAGYAGRWADTVISRSLEVVLAFPSTLLAIAIVAARGPGIENAIDRKSVV